MKPEIAVAWAAGLFEGEGCISFRKPQKRSPQGLWTLKLEMTDEDAVRAFANIVGCGRVSNPYRAARSHHKPTWTWRTGAREDVTRVLKMLLPYLQTRRAARADECLRDLAARVTRCKA